MYLTKNYKTKKEIKQDVADRNRLLQAPQLGPDDEAWLDNLTSWLTPFQPGLGSVPNNGTTCVEGPHYPQPHKWYASITTKDGVVVKVS